MFKYLITTVAFGLLTCTAGAQTTADEAQRRELAESILKVHYEIVDPKTFMRAMIDQMDGGFRQMVESPQSRIPKEKQAEALTIVQDEMRVYIEKTLPILDRIRATSVELYTTKYSLDELKALYAFTNSDLGRKNLSLVMKEMPAMLGPAMQSMGPLAQEMSKKIESRLNALTR
jgi:hypothetical protein